MVDLPAAQVLSGFSEVSANRFASRAKTRQQFRKNEKQHYFSFLLFFPKARVFLFMPCRVICLSGCGDVAAVLILPRGLRAGNLAAVRLFTPAAFVLPRSGQGPGHHA